MSEEASWCQSLSELGRTPGLVTFTPFNERLPLAIVDPEKIKKIVERLKSLGIEVLPDNEVGL